MMPKVIAGLLVGSISLTPVRPTAVTPPQSGRTYIAGLHKDTKPQEGDAAECDPRGKGSPVKGKRGKFAPVDTGTDLLKNRIDKGTYQPVTVRQILSLPWKGVPTRRYDWKHKDTVMVEKYESAPVVMEGYIISVKEEGKEGTNCGIDTHDWHDWHMWVVATEAEAHDRDKTKAVVVEITPRIRAAAAGGATWDKQRIMKWAHDGTRMSISGWLMFDPDHPSEVGKSRGTTWEIHPVMKLEPAP